MDSEKTQIAIISGYGEFAYAQKAIGLRWLNTSSNPLRQIWSSRCWKGYFQIAEVQAREARTESAREISATLVPPLSVCRRP